MLISRIFRYLFGAFDLLHYFVTLLSVQFTGEPQIWSKYISGSVSTSYYVTTIAANCTQVFVDHTATKGGFNIELYASDNSLALVDHYSTGNGANSNAWTVGGPANVDVSTPHSTGQFSYSTCLGSCKEDKTLYVSFYYMYVIFSDLNSCKLTFDASYPVFVNFQYGFDQMTQAYAYEYDLDGDSKGNSGSFEWVLFTTPLAEAVDVYLSYGGTAGTATVVAVQLCYIYKESLYI